jgi:pimeloyl-ACP methyl ester carboxylesterase
MKAIITLILTIIFTTATFGGTVRYKSETIDGQSIFYREAGNPEAPAILLLHGFPTSSQMYQDLMERLSDEYYMIAPDYPGFGKSSQPSMKDFEYSFANLTNVIEGLVKKIGLKKYSLYMMDYGAPIGFRLALKNPEAVESLIIQNGNAYDEGLRDFWIPIKKYWNEASDANAQPLTKFISEDGVRWQYTHGTRDPQAINPDNWLLDGLHLNRPGNGAIQLKLFYDYQTNVPLYPAFQAYFRNYQPPTLIVWGANDFIFPPEGAHPYKKDLPNAKIHLLDTGHFALEEDSHRISSLIREHLENLGK